MESHRLMLAKAERLQRCIERIHTEYSGSEQELDTNFLLQDSIILNLQRACEQTIDMGQILTRHHKLPRPTDNGELFHSLSKAGLIEASVADQLKKMVGFRNVAVHEYQQLDLQVVRNVITYGLPQLLDFQRVALTLVG